jgi:hypothetical protein
VAVIVSKAGEDARAHKSQIAPVLMLALLEYFETIRISWIDIAFFK